MAQTAQTWHRRSQATNGYARGPHDDPDRRHGTRRGAKIITLAMTIGTRFPALTDEQRAPGIRSIAAPVRDDASHVVAALNVSAHAAETSIETFTERYLPLLLETADKINADWTLFRDCLQITVSTTACSNAPL